jgi:hypothetical protein
MTEEEKKLYEWIANYTQLLKSHEENTTDWLASNKAQIFPLLKAAGIALVTVNYSGACGEAQVDNILATGPKAESGPAPEIDLPEAKVTLRVPSFDGGNALNERTLSVEEAIVRLCGTLLETKHFGWERNNGGKGTFTVDVATERIKLKHRHNRYGHEW